MSGLAGYIGHRPALPVLLDALTRLEYRGYDSAGIAVIENNSLKVSKTLGRPTALAEKLRTSNITGKIGIGHTRWASHGRPTIRNAHPQVADTTAVVHNGILDNSTELKVSLIGEGVKFRSETDSEILPHLINRHWQNTLVDSILAALKMVSGGLTFCAVSSRDPDQLVVVRKGNPMVVGLGEGEYIAASDVTAISPYTNRVVFLREGEMAVLSHEGVRFLDFDGKPIEHKPQKISWNPVMAEKRGYRHFLLKEIVESPRAVRETIATCLPVKSEKVTPADFALPCESIGKIEKIIFCGSGSSYRAGMLGQLICESIAGISTSRVPASEFQYGHKVVEKDTLYVAISQSGETLDTLESGKYIMDQGAKLLAITNNPSCSLARLADDAFITQAGPEISVASSKTFSAVVSALILLSFHVARSRGSMSEDEQQKMIDAIIKLPEQMELMVTYETLMRQMAERFAHHRSFFFVGRGFHYPLTLYASLMMKEVANVHAEGLLAGEIKHGSISLVEKGTPIMYFANQGVLEKQMQNDMDELRSRGANLIAIGFKDRGEMINHCDEFIAVPRTPDTMAPLLAIVPAQLFIYYVALYNKKDIDRPRNIAKSVTV